MSCFRHRGTAAVGLCKACGKAVCPDCVAPGAPALACVDGACAERVASLERMLDLNIKLLPRTERLAATAEHMTGAGERIQAAMFGAGRIVYLFNYAIGLGALVGGLAVVWKGVQWGHYEISLLGALLALIGAALTLVGFRAARAFRAKGRPGE